MTTIQNLTTATPVEIDTVLADLYGDLRNAEDAAASAVEHIHTAAEPNRRWMGRTTREPFRLTLDEAITKLNDENHRRATDLITRYHETNARVTAAKAAIEPYEAEFDRRGGWERAFLVTTKGIGHVHTSMHCSTCYPTTRYNWMVELSGQDRQTIIDGIREDACTACYPGAPVGPRTVFTAAERADHAVLEAERAAKAEKNAAKDAKAITHPDGGELRGASGVLKTERSAEMEYGNILFNAAWYGDGKPRAKDAQTAAYILVALAHKRGATTPEAFRALSDELDAKAAAKLKREKVAAEKHAKRLGLG